MLGVDFVINALFEISGFRPAGDWALAIAGASKRNATTKRSAGFTFAIVMGLWEMESCKACRAVAAIVGALSCSRPVGGAFRTAKRLQQRYSLRILFQFSE